MDKVPDHSPRANDVNPDLSAEGLIAFQRFNLAAVYRAELAQNAVDALGHTAQSVIASGGSDDDVRAALDACYRWLISEVDRALVDIIAAVDSTNPDRGDQP